jgi:hypothetical protein
LIYYLILDSKIYKNIILKALCLNLIVTVPCKTLKEFDSNFRYAFILSHTLNRWKVEPLNILKTKEVFDVRMSANK